MKQLDGLISYLRDVLASDMPMSFDEGYVVRDGYDRDLDNHRNYERNATQVLINLEEEEKKASGLDNMRIGYNNVFGYYFQVSRGQADKVPNYFIRKQTLTNVERFYTPRLKEVEDNILNAKFRAKEREKQILEEVYAKIEEYIPEFQSLNQEIASLDLFCAMAQAADEYKWTRPEFVAEGIYIEGGRHPLVEENIRSGDFVPNDLDFSGEGKKKFMLLTGPNMGGKSTFLRQNAVILYLGHLGSYIPADSAKFCLLDGIFSRVGASDMLSEGQSTFMVEMTELAQIIQEATDKSFVILDEVGRGTSTEDGLAIARSVMRYFIETVGSFTLFATHFFDLISDCDQYDTAANFHVDVYEEGEDIVFMHKILPGAMARSFGIHVARMSGLPSEIVNLAQKLLDKKAPISDINHVMTGEVRPDSVMSLFDETELQIQYNDRTNDLLKFLEFDLTHNPPLKTLSDLEILQKQLKLKEDI